MVFRLRHLSARMAMIIFLVSRSIACAFGIAFRYCQSRLSRKSFGIKTTNNSLLLNRMRVGRARWRGGFFCVWVDSSAFLFFPSRSFLFLFLFLFHLILFFRHFVSAAISCLRFNSCDSSNSCFVLRVALYPETHNLRNLPRHQIEPRSASTFKSPSQVRVKV